MVETFTWVHVFCRLVGHYWHFIKGFAHIARPLYDVLGKEVKMGLVQLPPEAQKAVRILKDKIQSAPMLVFLDFNKQFLLEMDASKEGLGAVLSQKEDDRCYHPVTFGSCSLTPMERNYHSSNLEFLALKWSVTEHFKEYLAYAPFVVRMDNNPLTYVLTTPTNRWVGALASFEFTLEYQKGADNRAADALSRVSISHDRVTVCSLLEGAVIGASDQSEAEATEALLCKHVHLEDEARVQAAKLAPMHVVNWEDAQESDTILAACWKWLKAHKATPTEKRDALLKKYLGSQADAEEGHALFHIHNSLVLSKGLLYISTMPKGELEGFLAFLVPSSQHTMALNSIHHDMGHQGQQRMLALAQEHFWWPMMVEDCKALIRGCLRCRTFKGVIPKAPLCPIRAHAPLELVHIDFTSVESTLTFNKPPSIKNVLVITDHFMCYALAVITKDQTAKTIAKVLYERFIMVFGMPAKLLSDWGGELYLGAGGGVVCCIRHSEVLDYRIPSAM